MLQTKSRTDKSAKEVDPIQPAFTRRREVFAGRLAMFGFAASLIGEVHKGPLRRRCICLEASCHKTARRLQISTGKGVLGQLSLETGLPTGQIELGLVALIGYNLFSVSPLLLGSPGETTFVFVHKHGGHDGDMMAGKVP